MFCSAGCYLLRAEGLSCSLGVLNFFKFWVIKTLNFDRYRIQPKMLDLDPKHRLMERSRYGIFFFSCKIFQFLIIKTMDPELDQDPQFVKILNPLSSLNQCADPKPCLPSVFRIRIRIGSVFNRTIGSGSVI